MRLYDQELTEKIIACACWAHYTLGAGFLEKVYENAMAIEMESPALKFRRWVPFILCYSDQVAGEYLADLRVEDPDMQTSCQSWKILLILSTKPTHAQARASNAYATRRQGRGRHWRDHSQIFPRSPRTR